jgi:hypothetical protein
MWELDRKSVDQKARLTNYRRKTMITIFFGVDAIVPLGILPQVWTLTSEYFQGHIIPALATETYRAGRKLSQPRYILHFNSAPVHDTEKPEQARNECKFQRLEDSPCPPDLPPCDLGLFGHLGAKTKLLSYGPVEELGPAMPNTIERIPESKLIAVFQAWRRRSQPFIENETALSQPSYMI